MQMFAFIDCVYIHPVTIHSIQKGWLKTRVTTTSKCLKVQKKMSFLPVMDFDKGAGRQN